MKRINQRIALAVFAVAFILSGALFLLARNYQGSFILLFSVLTWPSYLVGAIVLFLTKWQFNPGRFSPASLFLMAILFCSFSACVWALLVGYLARRREEPNQFPQPSPSAAD